MSRVVAVWNNNGSAVRGDLKAVVRTILLDDEARNPVVSVGFGEMINTARPHLFEAAWNETIKRGITTQQVFQQALT